MTDDERAAQNMRVWQHFHAPQGTVEGKQILKPTDKVTASLKKLGLTADEAKIFTGTRVASTTIKK